MERVKHEDGGEKYVEFPYASAAHKKVMVDLFLGLEEGLQNHLLPSSLPPDVQYYSNPSDSVQASFQLRSGLPQSPVDLIWGSWVHYERPNRSALEITSLSAYLKASTDAPNFGIDLIRHSPTVLVLILDLFHRTDLPLHPHYLKNFYEDTQLDTHREAFEKLPEVQPYISPSLYMRTTVSPAAIMVRIETEGHGGEERLEEIIRTHLDPISKQVLKTWLDHCAFAERDVGETERAYLRRRDEVMRTKILDIDLAPSLLEWFGEQQGKRIVDCLKHYFFSD